jgi:transaldolase
MANIWLNCENDNSLKDISSFVDDEKITGVMIDLSRYSSTVVDEDSYMHINIKDIQEACDKLIDLYDDGEDGFVACSIDPKVANDTKKIVQEVTKLNDMVDKENFMVSIPATKEGIEAMTQLSTSDINICATHIFSPNQASQSAQALSDLNRKADTVLRVDVSPFDELLNVPLATNNLSKDRIGFFNAIKIYNQISAMKLPNSNIKVCFDKLEVFQPWLEPSYYVEQLNLDNAILNLSKDTIEYISEHEVGEAFEFQTKHIDAFLGYLAYANVSLQSTYEELLQTSLQKDMDTLV